MFKFGFSHENVEDETKQVEDIKEDSQWIESEEIKPESVTLNKKLNTSLIKCGDYSIKYVTNEEVLNILKNRSSTNNLLLNAEHSHSDLITAVYEGGLKVWECTYDLLNFINDNDIDLSNKKVLDLGCGVGIIGIFSCLKGTTTFFQDYNSEVINQVTIPNILLNNIELDKCAFYCGDWKSFLDLLRPTFVNESEKFDYIFTSETIYNIGNYKKLLDIFAHLLKRNGVIYLAAKYYYFGVGGGIGQFEDMLKRNKFNSSICWMCSEGVKRAIIKITLK